jgi:transposase
MSTVTSLDRIGVGIDTARYGHRVSFLRLDHQPVPKPITVMENRGGYLALQQRLEQLHAQHPQAHFHIRLDAAGQYAANLEHFLRGLPLPMTLSIGEPKRNKDDQKAHFPKRTTDNTESQAMARFAVVEQPRATAPVSPETTLLREVAGRLYAKVKQSTQAINRLHNLLARVFPELATLTKDITSAWVLHLLDKYPITPHVQVLTIPGIGTAKAAVLVAKIVDINRFATPEDLVGYFGVFPEENSSVVDKDGRPLPSGTLRMSHKGNDLVRFYLWNATRAALCHNPAIAALYQRLKAKGKRGDVAIGHCMRKLLHLVFAVWKTNQPFDSARHATPQEVEDSNSNVAPDSTPSAVMEPSVAALPNANPVPNTDQYVPCSSTTLDVVVPKERAVGHNQDVPAEKVVTTANATVPSIPPVVNATLPTQPPARPKVDFAFLRQQVTMEQVLQHLGLLDTLRGRGQQRRCPCPIHGQGTSTQPTFSAHLGKNVFQCFQVECRAQGNVLDLWAAVHHLSLYEAALHLAETFGSPGGRSAPVQ